MNKTLLSPSRRTPSSSGRGRARQSLSPPCRGWSREGERRRAEGGRWWGPRLWGWWLAALYLSFMLLLPLASLLKSGSESGWIDLWQLATQPVALSAYRVTVWMALAAALFNGLFGLVLAWVLARYNFPGKRVLDAAVDLPFALPTSVAGLTIATVYSDQGWIGQLAARAGVEVVFTRLGIVVAMVFVSFPFVVRTMQPVIAELEVELEEAAWSLGASPWETFQRVVLPPLLPPLLTGVTLAFSRSIGEYGSIVIVSSNIPFKDLVASVLILQNLEQYEQKAATAVGTVVLLASLLLLLGANLLQSWKRGLAK